MRKKLILLFGALLALAWFQVVGAAVAAPSEYRDHMEKGKQYAKKELYEDALASYGAALELKPESAETKLAIAEMQLALGDKTAFFEGCRELVYSEPMSEEALYTLADYYAKDGKKSEIVAMLKDLKEKGVENAAVGELWSVYGGSYEELGYSYESAKPFYGNYALVENGGVSSLITAEGKNVLNGTYEEIGDCSLEENWIAVREDGVWNYITLEEHKKLVSEETYEEMGVISEGVIRAKKNGKYGFLDMELNPRTDFMWDAASHVSEGTAAVCKGGKWALTDENFELKTDYIYDDVAMDEAGFCAAEKRIFVKQSDGYRMVDDAGEAVSEQVYEAAKPFGGAGLTAVCMKEKWGYVNTEGELVIACQYEDAKPFANGVAPVRSDGKWGYIDMEGNMLIEPSFADAGAFNERGTALVRDDTWKLIELYAISN